MANLLQGRHVGCLDNAMMKTARPLQKQRNMFRDLRPHAWMHGWSKGSAGQLVSRFPLPLPPQMVWLQAHPAAPGFVWAGRRIYSCSAGTLAMEPSPWSLPFKLLEMHFLSAQLGRAPRWEVSLLHWQLATSQALLLTVLTSLHSVKHIC